MPGRLLSPYLHQPSCLLIRRPLNRPSQFTDRRHHHFRAGNRSLLDGPPASTQPFNCAGRRAQPLPRSTAGHLNKINRVDRDESPARLRPGPRVGNARRALTTHLGWRHTLIEGNIVN